MLRNEQSQYTEILNYLFGLQKFGMKLGLENIKSLLHFINNPHTNFPSIHIAGTNGKGSTASFIAAICSASGYKTGLYTSPHLEKFNERIRINAVPITDEQIIDYTLLLKSEVDALNATFFEATTATAFKYFADQKVDIAIIETGLGGRLDSTNVINPLLSIITNISLEHTEHLGDTVSNIAFEKAGIIKEKIPVLTTVNQFEALEVIRNKSIEMNSRCMVIDRNAVSEIHFENFDRMNFSYKCDGEKHEIISGFVGEHQITNCILAIESGYYLQKIGFEFITSETINKGISEVRSLSGLHCRLECIQTDPEIILDVAHNPDGFESLLKTFSRLRNTEKTNLIFGLLSTKDFRSIIDQIITYKWKSISIVSPKSNEAQKNQILYEEFQRHEIHVTPHLSVWECVEHIAASSMKDETILLCGSHYVVGEYLTNRKQKIFMTS